MQPWPKTNDDEIIKVGYRTLVNKTFLMPDGKEGSFTTKDAPDDFASAVIALTPENAVVIAEQFRPGPEKVMQEIPGGGGNTSEDPKDVAMRELKEETGYGSNEVVFLGKVHKDAYTNSARYYYLARNCTIIGETEQEDTEYIEVKTISIEKLFENARNTNMTDTEAVFLAYEVLKEIQEG